MSLTWHIHNDQRPKNALVEGLFGLLCFFLYFIVCSTRRILKLSPSLISSLIYVYVYRSHLSENVEWMFALLVILPFFPSLSLSLPFALLHHIHVVYSMLRLFAHPFSLLLYEPHTKSRTNNEKNNLLADSATRVSVNLFLRSISKIDDYNMVSGYMPITSTSPSNSTK